MKLIEVLDERIKNALALTKELEKCREDLQREQLDTFYKKYETTKELFSIESRLSIQMSALLEEQTPESEFYDKITSLETLLKRIAGLIEDSGANLKKMIGKAVRTQKENNAVGNLALKYYGRQQLIPKFIDTEG